MSMPIAVERAEPRASARTPRLRITSLRVLSFALAVAAVALLAEGEGFGLLSAATALGGWTLGD